MSFELVCESCGALSGPSVGMCPFCKSVLSRPDSEIAGQDSLLQMYNSGRVDVSLNLASKIFHDNPKAKQDLSFLMLYVKILVETEGPSSLINSLLTEGLLICPKNQELHDYLDNNACLALVYKALGNLQLSQTALRKCIELESNPNMKHFFKNELSKIN